MESQDLRDAVGRLVSLLRKITRIVQILPFVYLLFYSAYLLLCGVVSDDTLILMDSLLFVPLPTIIGFLFASRMLHLCIWHRAACLIPVSTKIENYIDCNIFQFTEYEIITINAVIGFLAMLFFLTAYRHFFYGRERTDKSHA